MLSPLRMPFRHARVAGHLQLHIIEQAGGICMSVCGRNCERVATRAHLLEPRFAKSPFRKGAGRIATRISNQRFQRCILIPNGCGASRWMFVQRVYLHDRFNSPVRYEPERGDQNIQQQGNPRPHERKRYRQAVNQQRSLAFQIFANRLGQP